MCVCMCVWQLGRLQASERAKLLFFAHSMETESQKHDCLQGAVRTALQLTHGIAWVRRRSERGIGGRAVISCGIQQLVK